MRASGQRDQHLVASGQEMPVVQLIEVVEVHAPARR